MIIRPTLESPAASSCPGHLFTILERVLRSGTSITKKFLPDLRNRTREQMRVRHRTYETGPAGSAEMRIGSLSRRVYGLIVVPRSIEMRSFSSPWYLSFGEASIVVVVAV